MSTGRRATRRTGHRVRHHRTAQSENQGRTRTPRCARPAVLVPDRRRQTVSNGAHEADDLTYGGGDLSYEAEDAVIKRCQTACQDLEVDLEPRNEARVHLWYEAKFGKVITRYRDLEEAIASFAATCCCVALNLDAGGKLAVHAPRGFDDLFTLAVRPSLASIAPRAVYEDKAERWVRVWSALTKFPWPDDPS